MSEPKTQPAASSAATTASASKTANGAATRRAPAKRAPAKSTQDAKPELPFTAGFGGVNEFFDQARERFDDYVNEMNAGAEAWRESAGQAGEAFRSSADATRDALTDLNTGMAEYVQDEVSRFMEFSNEVAKVKSLNDLFALQSEFLSSTLQSRFDKVRELNETAVDSTRRSMESLGESVSESISRAAEWRDSFTTRR